MKGFKEMQNTREQLQKLEEGCGNGFKLDIQNYLIRKEKQLIKYIDIEENQVLKAEIDYQKDESGQVPTLLLSVLKKDKNGYLSSDCKTQYISLGEPQKRKNFKLLKEYSNKITDDYISKVHDKEKTSKLNILFSED